LTFKNILSEKGGQKKGKWRIYRRRGPATKKKPGFRASYQPKKGLAPQNG
jgi:hypothetical protein